MQQIVVNIENYELEKKLIEEAQKKGRQLSNIILEVLEKNFLGKRKRSMASKYRHLNPLENLSPIHYEIDEDVDLSCVFPFEKVKDSAAYVKEMRKNAWGK